MNRPYVLLTGATGLLGEYLVRDILACGSPLAVLVRAKRNCSAERRIEIGLERWERQFGHMLPRPFILEGDLASDRLGLSDAALAWIARHCRGVVHNAASLVFVAEDREGEPWQSNVEGTRRLLALCEQTGLREFHHVSTAYVCGLRKGCILETELDAGQTFGNDYEHSKFLAEQLVRQAPFLDSLTVYRPGIIVGDSQTSYTSTYHGFYTPLKAADAMIDRVESGNIELQPLLQLFGLEGHEQKSFVPVDWVAAVMARIIDDRRLHGRTYHLTPRKRTRLNDMAECMAAVLTEDRIQAAGSRPPRAANMSFEGFQAVLEDQMRVYQAYWRDDPEFDCTNTIAAAGPLICPNVDNQLMRRLCKYALRDRFGYNGQNEWLSGQHGFEPVGPAVTEIGDLGPDGAETGEDRTVRIGLEVSGPGGGQWALGWVNGRVQFLGRGLPPGAAANIYLNNKTWLLLHRGDIALDGALRSGRVCLEGPPAAHRTSRHCLAQLLQACDHKSLPFA